jgi:hypothetical protein
VIDNLQFSGEFERGRNEDGGKSKREENGNYQML